MQHHNDTDKLPSCAGWQTAAEASITPALSPVVGNVVSAAMAIAVSVCGRGFGGSSEALLTFAEIVEGADEEILQSALEWCREVTARTAAAHEALHKSLGTEHELASE